MRIAALLLLCAILPLLWPAIPPLNDLPGHIGRYHIAAELARSPALQAHWRYDWALVGNLGVDLPAVALARAIGAEAAAKAIVLAIPALFVGGLLMLAHVRRQGVPPLIGFAAALAYGQAFQFGFVNFALSAALALWALAGWISLAPRPVVRAPIFAAVACALWIAHSFGWGLFGLAAFASEAALRRERGERLPKALVASALACLPLALPILAMIAAPAGEAQPLAWDWRAKSVWVAGLLRDRWKWFDVASAVVIAAILWTAVRHHAFRFDPVLGAVAAILVAAFVALPRIALGGAYVDMRMLAPAVAVALAAVRVIDPRLAIRLLLFGLAFLLVRTAATTASFVIVAERQQAALRIVPAIPRGAAVLVLVNEPCASDWSSDRLGHLAGVAEVRRDIFDNGQWTIAGQQLLGHRYPLAAPYDRDPSQLVYPKACEYAPTDFAAAVRDADRRIFTHVWTIGFPTRPRLARDAIRKAADGPSTLYRIAASQEASGLSPPAPSR
ncbi:hypothetical protein COC42_12555 [Sphingomonas spermidinifaciens]|uniref:Glycosyltransferase RgtA/B/C/D-like domain-containing protein n=2 Tax=Sphingomonas spermidinifaciens TaxID=1141889 RepID=A0A2A4B2V7_9SPHN|nr:hypothetical protein COC42_12555 [Sphingomonas spermidinifaciens]